MASDVCSLVFFALLLIQVIFVSTFAVTTLLATWKNLSTPEAFVTACSTFSMLTLDIQKLEEEGPDYHHCKRQRYTSSVLEIPDLRLVKIRKQA